MINQVNITKRAEKSVRASPKQIAAGFFLWKREVEMHGIEAVNKHGYKEIERIFGL